MADHYTEEIQKRMDALPPDIQALVYSADMGAILHTIGEKHQLHVDQIGALEFEAAAVMIGLTEPANFSQELVDALDVSPEKAEDIAKDIDNQLFIKIRESLKKLPSTLVTAAAAPTTTAPAITSPAVTTPSVSVVMPSAVAPKEITPTPIVITRVVPPPPATPPSTPAAPSMPAVEKMLTEKTTEVKPIYKTDPYREPPE